MNILVGTSKGLVVYHKKNSRWKVRQVHFRGFPISMVFEDERAGTWWVGISHRHWGQKLHFSNDQGNTWATVPIPIYPKEAELKKGQPAVLKKIWCMQHGGTNRPDWLWLGTEPGGLFLSKDNGQHFHLVEGLWNHPSRSNGQQWFGAGKDHPFIHSIVIDPRDGDHVYIAVSCAGVFETMDGGLSWHPQKQWAESRLSS